MIRLLAQWADDDPAALGKERVRDYFLHLVRVRSYAPKSLRQARAALSCFFIEMLGLGDWRVFDHIKTKDRQQLPVVLSRDEVRRVLSQVKELRFLAPLSLIYLCGLRLNEALHIETRDIHRPELRLHVRLGKGGKAMEYVARYVQKTALDAARIISINEHSVSYKWTHRESGQTRITTVKGHEFLRLFLQHVLPRGFRRVRHFGYLSAAAKDRYERLRHLLRAGTIVLLQVDKPAVCCSACGQAMTFLRATRHAHRARPPPIAASIR